MYVVPNPRCLRSPAAMFGFLNRVIYVKILFNTFGIHYRYYYYHYYYSQYEYVLLYNQTLAGNMILYYIITRALFQRRYRHENNMVFSGLSIAGTQVLLSVTDSR